MLPSGKYSNRKMFQPPKQQLKPNRRHVLDKGRSVDNHLLNHRQSKIGIYCGKILLISTLFHIAAQLLLNNLLRKIEKKCHNNDRAVIKSPILFVPVVSSDKQSGEEKNNMMLKSVSEALSFQIKM